MKLTNEIIAPTIKELNNFLKTNEIDKERQLMHCLLIEDLMGAYCRDEGETNFTINTKRKWNKVDVVLKIKGSKCDYIEKNKDFFKFSNIEKFDKYPVYKYSNGYNIYIFTSIIIQDNKKALDFVKKHLLKEKAALIGGIVLRFVNMALAVIEPLLSAAIIVAYSGSQIEKIIIIAALIMGNALLSAFITWGASRLLRKSFATMIKEIQYETTKNVLRIKTGYMTDKGHGVFTQRLTSDTDQLADHFDALLASSTEIFRVISLLIAFLVISPVMFVFEAIVFGIYCIIQIVQSKVLTDESRIVKATAETQAGFVGEMVKGHRDIKLLHSEGSFLKNIRLSINNNVDANTNMRYRSMKYIMLRSSFVGVTDFLYMGILALLMVFFGMQPATALTLFNYNGRVYTSANAITRITDTIYNIHLSAERIYQLVGGKDYGKEEFGSTHLDNVTGDIKIQSVSFAYQRIGERSVPVLNDVSLHIHPGESVAFVGESGCGKSTLLSLITKLYDPDSGSILIDDTDIRQLDQDSIRSNIAMVSQTPYIFNMSIRDNLSIVKHDVTEEEIIRVCKLACIHDDIKILPKGYDTIVGEGGVTLSGGQRQRLALARSMLKDFPILMLDEATSALDNMTQAKVQSAIENLRGKQTLIMIAHRLSTVINCDKLFLMSNGKVIAEGSHEELLKTSKEYRKLYQDG